MQVPTFSDFLFVSAALLNDAAAQVQASVEDITATVFSPGLVNQSAIVLTPSLLTVGVTFGSTARVVFGSGVLAGGYGTINGQTSGTYTVNLASFVPGTGSQTVYIVATAIQIGQQSVLITGPSQGHPDFDPTFTPVTVYGEMLDSVSVSATTTLPDNSVYVELCRVVLSSGETNIPSVDITHQLRAGAVLSRTGEVVAADLASGAAATNVGSLGGVLGGILPNPTMASGAAATNVGSLGGVLGGTLPNPSFATTQFASSLGTQGYKQIPDHNSPTGYILEQWWIVVAASGTWTYNFPMAFSNACMSIQISPAVPCSTVQAAAIVSASQYQVQNNYTGNIDSYMVARGY